MIKYTTFLFGMAFLYIGAWLGIAPDWDIGVSTIMGVLTFYTAQRSVETFLGVNDDSFLRAALRTWLSVDGAYTVYWFFVDKSALMMRDIQWPVSLCMYLICGLIWMVADNSKSPARSPYSR
jgi:hypothetical protein